MKPSLSIALLAVTLLAGCSNPPSDARLLVTFKTHRETFEQIKVRACTFGHYQTIGHGYDDPVLKPPEADWYRTRMEQIGVDGLHAHGLGRDCWVDLDVWSDGSAGTPARYKGFHFGLLEPASQGEETRIVSSLDHPKSGEQILTLSRPIGSGWWLQYTDYP
jgi:hypothetical protein